MNSEEKNLKEFLHNQLNGRPYSRKMKLRLQQNDSQAFRRLKISAPHTDSERDFVASCPVCLRDLFRYRALPSARYAVQCSCGVQFVAIGGMSHTLSRFFDFYGLPFDAELSCAVRASGVVALDFPGGVAPLPVPVVVVPRSRAEDCESSEYISSSEIFSFFS